ncbi:hypothetical protein QWZ13_08570 [Reinekea marina]|uniref:Secretory lipase n=1 Tax=Reinekea marina TaxID=1310421 RepID=A0ABV7WV04_9GAMM|nr:hypothetical protein [Reinekea marina]MDN3648962.1 hypothetical protein [Reinekea marina]
MYFDFDLAQQWVQLHIENPEGFDQNLVSDELMEHLLLNPTVYGVWPKAIVDYISPIPSEFTHCNETVGESTFKEIDLGVYGKYLDIKDYCWTTPVHSYKIPDTQNTQVLVAHSPFDPVIEQSDIQSYLTALPQTKTCYTLDAQHTIELLKLIPLINVLEEKDTPLPDFCQPDISNIVSQYPDYN